ncbi:biotin synthase BioB [Methanothermococcus okinawensis]|uniref:Biotin synthase n=1 Tax=Methanothermococcus okinawensis (strain DSM 14208 / JCM 11175 / IH1) TaxID=647113 RepID=F8ANR0_METOI|nr:biotin synthase BioB [Methanothermococcus okinawensis]AEH06258.1 Biotin synthase [Methanothermococcus okinawensis IH1]
MELLQIYEKSIKNRITYEDAVKLWDYDVYDLLYLAYSVKKYYNIKKYNNPSKFDLCSIINAKSGRCPENCAFCSQSIYNKTNINIYDLKPREEILKYAKYMEKYSHRFSIVVSGKTVNDSEFEKIINTIKEIIEKTNLKVCASLGILDKDRLKELKELNVRIHNNLETSRAYFDNICTTHKYDDKIKMIKIAKKFGLEVCSGGIFGLGETFKDRIKMFEELKNLNVNSVALNIIHPIEGTKTYKLIEENKIKKITPIEALKSMAIAKIYMPDREIRLCGGREYNLNDLQGLALLSLDGLMVGNYLTTKGRNIDDDIKMINDMGFKC